MSLSGLNVPKFAKLNKVIIFRAELIPKNIQNVLIFYLLYFTETHLGAELGIFPSY